MPSMWTRSPTLVYSNVVSVFRLAVVGLALLPVDSSCRLNDARFILPIRQSGHTCPFALFLRTPERLIPVTAPDFRSLMSAGVLKCPMRLWCSSTGTTANATSANTASAIAVRPAVTDTADLRLLRVRAIFRRAASAASCGPLLPLAVDTALAFGLKWPSVACPRGTPMALEMK